MINANTIPNEHDAREKKASWNAGSWALAWAVSVTLSCAAVLYLPFSMLFVGGIALCINVGIGLKTIIVYIRWLKTLDEMQRKMWLEAVAIAFGALWMALFSLLILYAAEITLLSPPMLLGLLSLFAGLALTAGYLISWIKHR